jgi:hypothetical protein
MSITRSQIARELMAEGGAPRQGYFLGKIVKKIKDDIIPNELKSPLGAAATAAALGYGVNKFGIPGTSGIGTTGENIGKGSISNIFKGVGNIFRGPDGFEGEEGPRPTYSDQLKKIQEKGGDAVNFLTKKRLGTDKSIASLLMSPEALSIGAGLVAGAFSKKEDDPLYTGQSVGLNLSDIRKLANISDQKTGAAIGLNFLPDTKFRKFSPTEMAATYAANQPVDFTEQRESAEEGGMMGDQKDFNKFLEDMKKRDYGRMREQILRDYEEYMRRKRMINQRPEVKNGGIMKEFKMASAPAPVMGPLDNKIEGFNKKMVDEFLQGNIAEFKGETVSDFYNRPNFTDVSAVVKIMEMGGTYDDVRNVLKINISNERIDDLVRFSKEDKARKKGSMKDGGIMEQFKMASAPDPAAERNDFLEMMSEKYYGKPLKDLTPNEFMDLEEALDNMGMKPMPKGRTMAAGGGLMNLGGMEMDLRGGGFVPIGAKEKADDVPARLSKNEFVFTADAVRAAGGGSVDKGADKMYATMKALENKVA